MCCFKIRWVFRNQCCCQNSGLKKYSVSRNQRVVIIQWTKSLNYTSVKRTIICCINIKDGEYVGVIHHLSNPQLTAITFTNVVFPEYCRPTRVSSISSFQNRLLNQSKILWKKANILFCFVCIVSLRSLPCFFLRD